MRECFALSFIRGMGQPYPRQSILIIKLPFFGTFIYSRLFENLYEEKKPLAFRYRPKTLEDFYGQEKLVGEKGVLKRIIEKGTFMNSIFWGAPGTGKTTLAKMIINETVS